MVTESTAIQLNVTPALDKALLEAQKAMPTLDRDTRNDFSNYNYTSSETVIDKGREALHSAGLTLTRTAWHVDRDAESTAKNMGSKEEWFFGMLRATFELAHPASGERRVMSDYHFPIVPRKAWPPDKTMSAALTTVLAYVYRDILQIPRKLGDEIDDRDDRDDRKNPGREQAPKASIPLTECNAIIDRLVKLGRTTRELAQRLQKDRITQQMLPERMDEWPANLKAPILRILEDAEKARREETQQQEAPKKDAPVQAPPPPPPPPAAPTNESGPPPRRARRATWEVSPNQPGTHPGYYIQRMRVLAQAAAAKYMELREETSEYLVESAESAWELPSPEQASPMQAVNAYKQAYERMRNLTKEQWEALKIPF